MSVTTTKTVELYKFSQCVFDWRDDRCNKSLADAGEITFASVVCEDFAAREHSFWRLESQRREKVLIVDEAENTLQKRLLEDMSIVLENLRAVNFQRVLGEAFVMQTHRNIEMDLEKKENLILTNILRKKINVSYREAACIAEIFRRWAAFYRSALAEISTGEGMQKKMEGHYHEALAMRGRKEKGMQALRREQLSFEEKFRRNLILRRDFKAKLGLGEKTVKKYALQKREAVTLYDAFVRACNAVLSNIGVSAGEMSFEDFMQAVDRPPNYDKFCDFNVGEYEYQKALVRFIMISKAAQTEPVLYDLTVHVDIDDTNDRGIAEITDTTAPTKVRFNKFYYHPPEVNVTLKGGNTADGWIVPYLIRTDGEDEYGRYFEVELRSSGQRVAGTISWTSKGY